MKTKYVLLKEYPGGPKMPCTVEVNDEPHAEYVLVPHTRFGIHRREVLDYPEYWEIENGKKISVDDQLRLDHIITGAAYYTIDKGIKTRIDPLKLCIIQ